ncbi:MAG: LamG domain-containing protein, partial [bacterium]|nr:LamG domain-containing protein [bacterium]
MKKILVSLTFLSALLLSVSTVNAATPPELVGWWRFEDNADDSSDYNNNATEVGDPEYINDGKVGKAIRLDGDGDYVYADVISDINEEKGTFELWVRPTDLTIKPQAFIVINTTAGVPHNYQIQYWTDGKLYFRVNKAGQEVSALASSVEFTQGDWHHLAMTWDSAGVNAYHDEALIGS